MSLNRFTPAQSRAVHLLKRGDVFVEFGPNYQKWTVKSDARIVRDGNNIEMVEFTIEEQSTIIRYPHYQRVRVKLWHDSQFTPYNYG